MSELSERIDALTSSISNYKVNLRNAILNKGGTVSSSSPTFAEIISGIGTIQNGSALNALLYKISGNLSSGQTCSVKGTLSANSSSYYFSTDSNLENLDLSGSISITGNFKIYSSSSVSGKVTVSLA